MIARWLAFLVVALACTTASAHGFRPGVLALTEEAPGLFVIAWTEPVDTERSVEVHVELPASCVRDRDRLACGDDGLRGAIEFRGLAEQRAPVTTLVRFLDGRTIETIVHPDAPRLEIDAPSRASPFSWVELGLRHIFGGVDHLAFLFGLLLVVGTASFGRLALTVSAFTVAHSITLALGATGILQLRTAPVEAAIAASVVLVAYEGLHERKTLTRRAPWVVALAFGLVHGLGFAGALADTGLPTTHVALNLLAFNAGIEIGQLALVVLAVAATRVLPLTRLRTAACYAIGSAGAWWLISRTIDLFTAAS